MILVCQQEQYNGDNSRQGLNDLVMSAGTVLMGIIRGTDNMILVCQQVWYSIMGIIRAGTICTWTIF